VKDVKLTRHAEVVAVQRRIDPTWIELAAREPHWVEPDQVIPGGERRYRAIDEFDGRYLRVVCVETDIDIRVVTVFFDRKAKRPS
jgi:hypothetical protein